MQMIQKIRFNIKLYIKLYLEYKDIKILSLVMQSMFINQFTVIYLKSHAIKLKNFG